MTQSQKLRDAALSQTSDRNPLFKERALARISEMRKGHLRSKYFDRVFTCEELMPDVETLVGFPIPAANLAGSVIMDCIRMDIIEPTGRYRNTVGEVKHARKSAEYRWKLY